MKFYCLFAGGTKEEKKDDEDLGFLFPGQGAFLGPNLWDKSYDDFKLEYMDLDEFLHENGIPLAMPEGQEADKTSAVSPGQLGNVVPGSGSPARGEVLVDPSTFSPRKGMLNSCIIQLFSINGSLWLV